jgi:hypothetical protein
MTLLWVNYQIEFVLQKLYTKFFIMTSILILNNEYSEIHLWNTLNGKSYIVQGIDLNDSKVEKN